MPTSLPEPLRIQRPEQGTYLVLLSKELCLRIVVDKDDTTHASYWFEGTQLGEEKQAAEA